MYEGLSSPNIHTPKSISEYASIVLHYPLSKIWAGGTFIMTRPDAYPSKALNAEIIYLGEMEELHRFQRNDRSAEFGAMVTLDEILNTGKSVLPRVLIDNITSIGSRVITRRATIGGAIATHDFTTSFPGTLIVLDASAEVRFLKKKRLHSRWMQMTRLLDKNGRIGSFCRNAGAGHPDKPENRIHIPQSRHLLFARYRQYLHHTALPSR